jgi:AraC-like DNA-binding protein
MQILPFMEFMSESFPFKIEIKENRHFKDRWYHAHEYFQICYVDKGTCIHVVNEKKATLIKGDLFCIPPLYEHRLEMIPDKEFTIVHIDFMPFLFDRSLVGLTHMDSFVDFAFIQPFVHLSDALLPKLNLSFTGQRIMESLIVEMIEETNHKNEGYQLIIKSNLQKLLVIAGREFMEYSKQMQEQQMIHLQRKHFDDALNFIDEHFMNPITLQDAAAKAVMSPTYFSSIFKLLKGTNYVDYVNDLRLNRAIDLLKEAPGWSVESISSYVGFNHMTHFYRMFKRKTGVTPAEFRRRGARL